MKFETKYDNFNTRNEFENAVYNMVICLRLDVLTIHNWIDLNSSQPPVRRHAITWNNAGILSIGPLGTNFSEIRIGILSFSFEIVVCHHGGHFVKGRWINGYVLNEGRINNDNAFYYIVSVLDAMLINRNLIQFFMPCQHRWNI